MGEQDNTRVVQEAYDAFGRGDLERLLALMADDVEWHQAGPSALPTAGDWHGRERVRRFFAVVAESFEFDQFEPREYIGQGDRVVVLGYYRGRAKATGRHFESHWAMAFTVRNGKIAQFREYVDTAALVAAFAGP